MLTRNNLRWLLAAVAALTLAALWAVEVGAHADLIATEPTAGSTVTGSPAIIRLSFSQPLLRTSRIRLFAGQFVPVAGLTTTVAGSEMQAILSQPLAPATYTVQWTAATDDGHATEGSDQFGVAAPAPFSAGRVVSGLAMVTVVIGVGVGLFVLRVNRRQRML